MDLTRRLEILSDEARHDLACACGTNDDDRRRRGENGLWVYPVSLPQGGKGIMLKTLVSNVCVNDCLYCPLRSGRDIRRCSLSPDEVADVFMEYKRRLNLFGLFLTSSAPGTPDQGMERLAAAAEILRKRHRYRGYIHLKILPGASPAAIEHALSLASTVSLNVEAPTADAFKKLSLSKDFTRDIVEPIKLISRLTARGGPFQRVRQTTQFIVGASDETDRQVISAAAGLYKNWHLHRVYFSAYQKGLGDPSLPAERPGSLSGGELLTREHRLYQADFLLRKYGWDAADIPLDAEGRLRRDIDPKRHWAELHPEYYPVRLDTADREALLRVPGLGPTYVARILEIRARGRIRDLSEIGMRGRRLRLASAYITSV